ncbi:MAG: ABC transporter ATP-binding protein [Halanaerobiales bacterium]|nr:ABC transporter ATP-binding protein [Halanaerobiales bacterium]
MIKNFKYIIEFYKLMNKKRLLLIFVGGIMVSIPIVLNIIYPLLIKNIIEALETVRVVQYSKILLLGGLYAFSLLISYVGDLIYLRNKYIAAQEMRKKVYDYSFYFPLQKFYEKGSAYFANLISSQINSAFVVIDYMFIKNIFLAIRTIIVLAIIFSWSKLIFCVFIANTMLVTLYSKLNNNIGRPYVEKIQECTRNIMTFIVETFDLLHELMAGEAIEKRKKHYNSIATYGTSLVLKIEYLRVNLDKFLMELPQRLTQIFLLVYCCNKVVNGEMTIGIFWAIWSYFSYVIEPISALKDFSQTIMHSSVTLQKILEFFNESQTAKNSYRQISADEELNFYASENPLLEVKDLSFSHGEKETIKDISFEVRSGQQLGIIGISGEGKSTLLNIITGFERTYQGQVKLFGFEIKELSPQWIFKNIGFYSQSVGILNDTLEENIVLGRSYVKERLDQIIADLKIEHLKGRQLGDGGNFVSGGEKQKIQLARFLFANKPFFVLDEPFSNLDAINEKLLIKVIKEYMKDKTGITISHRLNIMRLANTYVTLNNGKIVGKGTLQELYEHDSISRELIKTYVETVSEASIGFVME